MTRTWHIFPSLTYPGDPTGRAGRASIPRQPHRQRERAHQPPGPWETLSFTLQPGKGLLGH